MRERKQVLFPTNDSVAGMTVTKHTDTKKIAVLIVLVGIACTIIFIRLFQLQILHTDAYRGDSIANRIRTEIVPAQRGIVYDRNGSVLAENSAQYVLVFDPRAGEWPAEYIFPETWPEIRRPNTLSSYWPSVVQVIPDALAADYMTDPTLPESFSVVSDSRRTYPEGAYASSVLGYIGRITESQWEYIRSHDTPLYRPHDWYGQSGLESAHEFDMRGEARIVDHYVDAFGVETYAHERQSARPGADVHTTVDIRIQRAVIDAYRKQTKTKPSLESPGAVVVSDPRTGEVLALASFPTYDPENISDPGILANPASPLLNRAIAGTYPSGSVIKPYFALIGLANDIIAPHTVVSSTGGIWVGNRLFPDWKPGGHGPVNVYDALAWSVNTFFYMIGGGYGDIAGLGIDAINMYVSPFLAEKTNIGIPGERSGFVPSREWKQEYKKLPWYIGDTYNVSIGQGDILTTPMELHHMTAFIANKGLYIEPRLIKDAQSIVRDMPEHVRGIPKEDFETVWKGMRGTITYGSGRRLAGQPYLIYGKTGTAQWSRSHDPHAWFTCFLTNDAGEPVMAITVLIESAGDGSAEAVPVVQHILDILTEDGAMNAYIE